MEEKGKNIVDDLEQFDDDSIITLYNQSTDRDEEFYPLATIDFENRWFIVLEPAEELEDIKEGEVLIMEIVEDKGESQLIPITDEKLLDNVFQEFLNLMEEEDVPEEE